MDNMNWLLVGTVGNHWLWFRKSRGDVSYQLTDNNQPPDFPSSYSHLESMLAAHGYGLASIRYGPVQSPTTESHYNKYKEMRKRLGVAFTDAELFGVKTVERLRELHLMDPNLNNIPLQRFDGYAAILQARFPRQHLSIAEGVCLAKHCLVYDVLGATPVFQDW